MRAKEINIMTCYDNNTLREAMEKLDISGKGIIFIENKLSGKLCGIMTDGDIRRALLAGAELSDLVNKYMNVNYIFKNYKENLSDTKIFNNKIKIIPVVDNEGILREYIEFSENIRIPVANPAFRGNELKYLTDAFLSTWISSTGEYIDRFEHDFASYCGIKYGIATSNGTTAIHLALLALGISKGDEVIVPDLTFAATINAVLMVGATPVIVDIDELDWCISTQEIEKAITSRTKAIIPVHLYGQPCNMSKIMEIAKEYNLYIIEDCAEAHGATYEGKKVGSFGDIACFSFFGNKVITTGEGGICLTNSLELMNIIRKYKDHGMNKEKKYYHDVVGYNYRMTNLQAAIGVAQIEKLDSILNEREEIENYYRKKMSEKEGIVFQKNDFKERKKITWLVSILVAENQRERCIKKLNKNGIDVRPFFIPLSQMDIYKEYVISNKNSISIANRGLNLPTSLNISNEDIEKIIKLIDDCLNGE